MDFPFQARRLMRQLFDGVSFMHSRNIVHRDLKLENVLCVDDERIVISDFGFATVLEKGSKLKGITFETRVRSRTVFVSDLCGTPGYLAPETLRCQMFEDAEGYSHPVRDTVGSTVVKNDWTGGQLGSGRDHVYSAGWIRPILSQEAAHYDEDDSGWLG